MYSLDFCQVSIYKITFVLYLNGKLSLSELACDRQQNRKILRNVASSLMEFWPVIRLRQPCSENECFDHFYRQQRSCGKVMFSQASVILFTAGGVYPSMHWGRHPQADTPWQTLPGRHLLGRHPPWADTPWADTHQADTIISYGYC